LEVQYALDLAKGYARERKPNEVSTFTFQPMFAREKAPKRDGTKAFRDVMNCAATTRLTGFKLGDRRFVALRLLLFGSAVSAATLCRFINMLREYLRRQGLAVFTHIDDTFGIAIGADQAHSAIALVRSLFAFVGIQLNEEKGHTSGQAHVEFNGIIFHLPAMTMQVKPRTV